MDCLFVQSKVQVILQMGRTGSTKGQQHTKTQQDIFTKLIYMGVILLYFVCPSVVIQTLR